MPESPNYAIPYLEADDEPNIPLVTEGIATVVDAALLAGAGDLASEAAARAAADDTLTTPGWTAYTPAWTAASSNPAIGNGTIVGEYRRVPGSDLVIARGRILMGSTTTYGTGRWLLSLPLTAAVATLEVGAAMCYDASSVTSGQRPAVCWHNSATLLRFTSTSGEVFSTSPFTWAQDDQLRWSFTYEPA